MNYRFTVRSDAADRIEEISMTFQPVAAGSLLNLGLALRIPVASNLPNEYAVTLQAQDDPEPTVLTAVASEPELTWVLLSNVRSAFCITCSDLAVNTQPENPPITPSEFEFLAVFNPPIEANLEQDALDLFVFRTDNFSHQIHLPQYEPYPQCPGPGTAAVYSCELFGTQDDCSDSDSEGIDNTGRFFVDCEGIPWAIDRVFVSPWPKEGVWFKQAFPDGFHKPGKPELLYYLTGRINVPVLRWGALLSLLIVLLALGVKRAVRR
ncbi:MAG: LruC domain-containing protein [bacterium]|nr:LruC domain-containing protein [bacterium]